jgi:hypothetical protein
VFDARLVLMCDLGNNRERDIVGKMNRIRAFPIIDIAKATMLSVLPSGASLSEHLRSLCFWIILRAVIRDYISSDFLRAGVFFAVAAVFN